MILLSAFIFSGSEIKFTEYLVQSVILQEVYIYIIDFSFISNV